MAHKHYYLKQQAHESSTMPTANLLYSGTVKDDPNWFNIPHKHDFCEILYVAHGSGHVVLGGVEYHITEGDLLIINPDMLHEEQSIPDDPLNLIFIAVNNFQIGSLPPNCLLAPGSCPLIKSQKYRFKLEGLFADIIRETSGVITFYAEMSACLVNTLILLILRMLLVDGPEEEEGQISSECQKIKTYIDQNYTSPITLDELSENVYISKHHLAHMFKQQTGTSPIKYMINCRIEEACRLLVETNHSISRISAMVGYDDSVYFSQIFKRTQGVSPLTYRKNNKL